MASRLNKVREFARDGVNWRVREADTSRNPGSRGDRCLIFDTEGVVRRAWDVPEGWDGLSEDDLWALLDNGTHPLPSVRDRSAEPRAPSAEPCSNDAGGEMVAAATVAAARARSLLVEVRLILEANEALRAEQREMLDEARRVRHEMRMSIQAYAERLRREGFPPERALLCIKAAMQEGLSEQSAEDAPVNEGVVADGIAWGIAAYYAA